jgi:arabinofuranosyltransferase
MPDHRKPAAPRRQPILDPKYVPWLILALCVGVFLWHTSTSAFLQDDSFITYRYARNVIRGVGPVFNPTERVEGYTNFLWLMLLSALGILGVPFTTLIPLSQVLGVLCGVGIIVLFFFFLRRHSTGPPLLAPLALLPLVANGSFAYWCVSGMESALFGLFLAGAFYAYVGAATRARLVVTSGLLGLAALTRPEGALFAALFALHFAVTRLVRDRARLFSGTNLLDLAGLLAPFFALVVPLYAWRLGYYGFLFPNTFYAKTGASLSYLKSGIEYLWGWLRAFGLFGLLPVLAVVLALRKRRPRPAFWFSLLVLGVFSAYVVSVGGDVLRIYRFFAPVYFLFYFIVAEGFWAIPGPRAVPALLLVLLAPYTFIGPFAPARTMRAEVLRNLNLEKGLVTKMSFTGRWLGRQLGPDDWFACSTIGAVSYNSDRNCLDLLGLTDTTIAHHPENILGARVYWKERNYNTRHVLERNPRYIYFSTGIKPSAAAERALFLRTRFRLGYFPCPVSIAEGNQLFSEVIYKARPGADTLPIETPGVNPEFVELYNLGINGLRLGPDTAYALFANCLKVAPPDFAFPYEWMGEIAMRAKREAEAVEVLERAVAIDDWCINSHINLANIYFNRGDFARATGHLEKVVQYAPDYYEGYTNLFAAYAQSNLGEPAERLMLEALRRFPTVADLAVRLAYARMLSGKLDQAESDLQDFLARNPGHREASAILQQVRARKSGAPAPSDAGR